MSSRAEVHATVRTFDGGATTVVTDAGEVLTLPRAAFEASGLLLLRPGQRVAVVSDAGDVVLVTIPTLLAPAVHREGGHSRP